jgi:hypothetical protein
MTRLTAGFEGLDDEHAAAAARARMRERLRRIGLARLLSFCQSISRRWGQVREVTHRCDRFGAVFFLVVGLATGTVAGARSNPHFTSEFGILNQRLQLGPGDLGMATAAEAAISARHHILRPHETRKAADALSH